jgi:hypothetical protein
MNRSQTRPEIGEGGFETGCWAFRCRHPLFPLVRGVRREHLWGFCGGLALFFCQEQLSRPPTAANIADHARQARVAHAGDVYARVCSLFVII